MDFTNWIAVPLGTINILTDPKDLVIRQGDERWVIGEFETSLSDNVASIIFDNGPSYSFDGLNVSAERVHPPILRVKASSQTTIGCVRNTNFGFNVNTNNNIKITHV